MTVSGLYEAVGGDMENVLERLGDRETAEHFLRKFPDDPSYALLTQSLRDNDLPRAFLAAHTLKGVSLSLGLKRLGDCSGALCEVLRQGIPPSAPLLQQLETEYGCVLAAIRALENN